MRLAGDLAEFSLPDLIQVKSAARQTAALRILGPEGNGLILIRDGEVIHAQYEELAGEAAFHSLLGVKAGYFEAADVPENAQRTVNKPLRQLLMDAHGLAEKGTLPHPVRRATLPGVTMPPGEIRTIGASRVKPKIGLFSLAISAALLLGVLAAIVFARPEGEAPAARSAGAASLAPAPADEKPVEADELTKQGDRKPRLVRGDAPPSPVQDAALLPTIVLRLRIDSRGHVAEAKVYRSRVELAAFESAAVAAVEKFTFEPAQRNGKPVAVWINWPVEFR